MLLHRPVRAVDVLTRELATSAMCIPNIQKVVGSVMLADRVKPCRTASTVLRHTQDIIWLTSSSRSAVGTVVGAAPGSTRSARSSPRRPAVAAPRTRRTSADVRVGVQAAVTWAHETHVIACWRRARRSTRRCGAGIARCGSFRISANRVSFSRCSSPTPSRSASTWWRAGRPAAAAAPSRTSRVTASPTAAAAGLRHAGVHPQVRRRVARRDVRARRFRHGLANPCSRYATIRSTQNVWPQGWSVRTSSAFCAGIGVHVGQADRRRRLDQRLAAQRNAAARSAAQRPRPTATWVPTAAARAASPSRRPPPAARR